MVARNAICARWWREVDLADVSDKYSQGGRAATAIHGEIGYELAVWLLAVVDF